MAATDNAAVKTPAAATYNALTQLPTPTRFSRRQHLPACGASAATPLVTGPTPPETQKKPLGSANTSSRMAQHSSFLPAPRLLGHTAQRLHCDTGQHTQNTSTHTHTLQRLQPILAIRQGPAAPQRPAPLHSCVRGPTRCFRAQL